MIKTRTEQEPDEKKVEKTRPKYDTEIEQDQNKTYRNGIKETKRRYEN